MFPESVAPEESSQRQESLEKGRRRALLSIHYEDVSLIQLHYVLYGLPIHRDRKLHGRDSRRLL